MPSGKLYNGDCRAVMRTMPDNSVSSIVTDPPYGLKFMGKKWDYDVPSVEIWRETLRVLKPGGTALIFAGSRTQHRMAVNIEDAGFILKDCIMWIYGSGFPKSTDISKQIDKKAGVEREKIPNPKAKQQTASINTNDYSDYNSVDFISPKPATPAAQLWNGYGTALKPAYEPIIVAMKPNDGTYANNALKHGVAGINIDGCRVPAPEGLTSGGNFTDNHDQNKNCYSDRKAQGRAKEHPQGRFPANIIHDGSEEVLNLFPETKSGGGNKANKKETRESQVIPTLDTEIIHEQNSGSAARFFYCAKASKKERGEGNTHPTVKPLALMKYLVKLVIPPTGGIILDPFLGSGTTGIACKMNGVSFIGIEKDTEHGYYQIALNRITNSGKNDTLNADIVQTGQMVST